MKNKRSSQTDARRPSHQPAEKDRQGSAQESCRPQRGHGVFNIFDFCEDILDYIVDGVCVTDSLDFGVYVNQGLLNLAGISKDKFLGVDVLKNFPEHLLQHVRPIYDQARRTLEPLFFKDIPVVVPSGRETFLSGCVIPIVKDGAFNGMICTVKDITESTRMTEAVRENENRYRILFNNGNDSVYVYQAPESKDLPGGFIEVNDTACRRLGYTREELLRMSPVDIDDPETISFLPMMMDKLLRQKSAIWECLHITKDGRKIPVEISAYLFEVKGKSAVLTIARDITERKKSENALKLEKDRIQKYLDIAGMMFVALDANERVTLINKKGCRMLGYREEELLGKNWFDTIIPERIKKDVRKIFRSLMAMKHPRENDYENPILTKDGTEKLIAWHNTFLTDEQGRVTGTLSSGEDITLKRQAEAALRESEEKYRQLFELESDAIFLIDNETEKILDANTTASALYGYSREEFLAKKNTDLSDEPEKTRHVVKSNGTWVPLRWHRKNDGIVFPVEITARHFSWQGRKVHIASIRDITKRLEAEEAVLASLREKEVLLKEIHHRVKNNMQIISSLLNLQLRDIQDPNIVKIFRESQSRIRSIALAHEKLYMSRDLSNIDFTDYVKNLCVHLFQINQINSDLIKLNVNLENIFFDIQTAIPCGLILNELVTNSLKHAFAKGQKGEIGIELRSLGEELFRMVVHDNGVGIPENINIKAPHSFGLQIVSMLVHQLDGKIDVQRNKGTAFVIIFRESPYKARI